MYRTAFTTRTATITFQLRELIPVVGAPGDTRGTFVQGLADAIRASNNLRGHFPQEDVTCTDVRPDRLVVRYHRGSVHHDVFVAEIKRFIPAVQTYIQRWLERPVQWLDYSFDVATGAATTGYDALQFDQGFLGMQFQESMMNSNYLNEHVPCNPQVGIEVNTPSHMDTIQIINAPGAPDILQEPIGLPTDPNTPGGN